MAEIVARHIIERRGGHMQPLPSTCPSNPKPDKTILIRIEDVNPRRMKADMKIVDRLVDGDQLLKLFDDWGKSETSANFIKPRKKTRIDINIKAPNGAVVAFHLDHPHDVFMSNPDDPIGRASLAISGGDENATGQLCDPRWVIGSNGIDFKTAQVTVSYPADTQYNLGIHMADSDDPQYGCPIFIDPKIENQGG